MIRFKSSCIFLLQSFLQPFLNHRYVQYAWTWQDYDLNDMAVDALIRCELSKHIMHEPITMSNAIRAV